MRSNAIHEADVITQLFSVSLLPISLAVCTYALHTFLWSAERIKMRTPGSWEYPLEPVILARCLGISFPIFFVLNFYQLVRHDED